MCIRLLLKILAEGKQKQGTAFENRNIGIRRGKGENITYVKDAYIDDCGDVILVI